MATENDEDAPHRADLQSEFIANLLLIKELHEILGHAVFHSGLDGLQAFIYAELAAIGLKLGIVSPALYDLDRLDVTILRNQTGCLSKTLALLDRMVRGDLITDYKQLVSSKVNQISLDEPIQNEPAWPGLILLHDIIASRYKTALPSSKESLLTKFPYPFSDEKLCSYLVFDMEFAQQDQLLENLVSLNRDLDEFLAVARSKISQRLNAVERVERDEDDIAIAEQAQDYRQQLSNLYKTLAKTMGSCEEKHMAQLCLSNFGIDKNTLNIYISVCRSSEADSQVVAWHPTKCSKKDHAETTSIPGSFCQYLHVARARRLPVLLTYSNESLSEDSREVNRLPQEDLLWSFVDLAAVLEETSAGAASSSHIRTADKLRLQCLLTQSLLFLHPSSWMPESLELNNIYFMAQQSAYDVRNPYINCAFQEAYGDYVMPDMDAVIEFMIRFGLLLLQIEVERSLVLSNEEKTSQYGHELALARYMEQYDKDLNIRIKSVLSECLWFKRCLGKIPHPKMPLDLKIRFAVSQHILKPLVGSLEFNYPNVAREILPYNMEKRHSIQKIERKSARQIFKRKPDGVTVQFLEPRAKKIGEASPIPGPGRSRLFQSHPLSDDDVTPTTLPEHYSIGWISALPLEKAVACEMLDEEYPKSMWPWYDAKRDHNSYTFGRLHGHNIVIACLPKGRYGITSAAIVADRMQGSFPAIKFALLVGIAGGAPSQEHDIRLGDVVVSIPTDGQPGIIQYDYGKALTDHHFEETGHMTPPPERLLTHVASLEAKHRGKGHQLAETVANIIANNTRLRNECSRPPPHTDHLYKASYKHFDGGLCACQTSEGILLGSTHSNTGNPHHDPAVTGSDSSTDDAPGSISVSRTQRDGEANAIKIHYGLVASANRLMKDADARDVLIQKYDVLCFEMEAAGIVNNLPCIVIRGICDYSDSHKNDLWQGYAAANAAAYAKELLEIIPSHDLKKARSPS